LALYRKRQGPSAVPPQVTAQAYAGYQVMQEALARVGAGLPKGSKLSTVPLKQLRRQLMASLQSGTYQTPLGEIRFSPEGEVIQKTFSVARVSMNTDGRTGRFVLLP
jgi:branched-chain amino acid transport system substrate-binding protein